MAGNSDELRVDVVPTGPAPEAAKAAGEAALQHPAVRERLVDSDYRLLSVSPIDADGPAGSLAPTKLRATVYDYTNERALLVDLPTEDGGQVGVTSTVRQPIPSDGEFESAADAIRDDPDLGTALREGRLRPYRPMPPLVLDEQPDGRVERTIAVGLRPTSGSEGHEIVGVTAATGAVTRFEGGAPPGSAAGEERCGPPSADQPTARRVPGQARLTVSRGGETLWRFTAVRPAASSGTDGSGIELRSVSYRGKRVLRRAHVPILNVRYDPPSPCGPFRDWQNQEDMFMADGIDFAPGFRLCDEPPQTIFDSGSDEGNFLGVAIHTEGEETVLVSELQAGWYRYLSQWRLHADGTIRPRFGFAAVDDSCTCDTHHHHVYWRFDFDVVNGAHNAVREFNDPPVAGSERWHTLRHEIRRRRSLNRKRRWRVVNRVSGESYNLRPGPDDGTADDFGVGDMWALRRRGGQIDDGPGGARARIDRFVNGESIFDTDVVLWYAAHFSHESHAETDDEHEHDHAHGHIVGPDLWPRGW